MSSLFANTRVSTGDDGCPPSDSLISSVFLTRQEISAKRRGVCSCAIRFCIFLWNDWKDVIDQSKLIISVHAYMGICNDIFPVPKDYQNNMVIPPEHITWKHVFAQLNILPILNTKVEYIRLWYLKLVICECMFLGQDHHRIGTGNVKDMITKCLEL